MKKFFPIAFMLFAFSLLSFSANAQILKKIKNRVVQTAENKIVNKAGNATSTTMDNAEKEIKGEKKENSKNNSNNTNVTNNEEEEVPLNSTKENKESNTANTKPAFKSYSKFDFVAGENTVFYEDFSSDAIGDFPARWNTNVSGEIVTTTAAPGKWFRLKPGGGFIPDLAKELPGNFTIEMDMIMKNENTSRQGGVKLSLFGGGKSRDLLGATYPGDNGVNFQISVHRHLVRNMKNGKTGEINASQDEKTFFNGMGIPQRISIWRQSQRVRLYINEKKIFDLPRALEPDAVLTLLRFHTWGTILEEDVLLISNLRIAVGAPDMRNKLITEGKFVTQGILFDVNSDKIKPESYGTLKNIADVLKENAGVKVKIVGHTDSDGDDAANLVLSKQRAASVKNTLSSEYGIETSRLETDGLGESAPIADNKVAEGKANNRRVEFIKL